MKFFFPFCFFAILATYYISTSVAVINLILSFLMATLKSFCSSSKFFSRKRNVPSVSSLQPSPMESRRRRRNAISSSWIYLKKIFTSKLCTDGLDAQLTAEEAAATATVCSSICSMHSVVSAALPETMAMSDSQRKFPVVTRLKSDISADHQFFPLRNDIFLCPACGEIFRKPHILEQHQSLKHAVSEHIDGDSGNNIVPVVTRLESDIFVDHQFFPLWNDIFPCPA